MGRYTQRRRAATSPAPGAAALLPFITSVHRDGSTSFTIFFSSPVVVDELVPPGTAFTIGAPARNIDSISDNGPTETGCSATGTFAAGAAWSLTAQPAWCLTPIRFPASGTAT